MFENEGEIRSSLFLKKMFFCSVFNTINKNFFLCASKIPFLFKVMKQANIKKPLIGALINYCGPGGSRTPNLLIRSQMLYPIKLQNHF